MDSASGDLIVRVLRNDDKPFAVVAQFRFHAGRIEGTIPAGFKTDFASVPQPLRFFIDRIGKHSKAAAIHDYLYRVQAVRRSAADLAFLDQMKHDGVTLWRRYTLYLGVRLFGWYAWNNRKALKKD